MAGRDDMHRNGDAQDRADEQSGHDGRQGGPHKRQENSHEDAEAQQVESVPQGGLNPEIGDIDAEADPDRKRQDGDNGLPGKAGGGLMGG